MEKSTLENYEPPENRYLYHGTRLMFNQGDLIQADNLGNVDELGQLTRYVYLTPQLDEAIWDAEIASGEGAARVYIVEANGPIGLVSDLPDHQIPGHPSMSYYTFQPIRVIEELSEWTLYHGTRADLKPGDMIETGHTANFGAEPRTSNFVYLARTLDAAIWGAELAKGEGPGKIYIVKPTGPIEDDPNLTDKKFRGNPTKSFRSRDPLLITGEVHKWQGHSPESLKAMRDGIERLTKNGVEPIDD